MINVYNRHNTNSFNPKPLKAIVKASIDNGGMISVVGGSAEIVAYKEFSTYFLDLLNDNNHVSGSVIDEQAILQFIDSIVDTADRIEMNGTEFFFEM